MEKRVYYNRQTAGSAGFLPLQLPRFLFSADTPAYMELAKLSNNAKILYALFLDRLATNEMSINFLEKPWHNDEKLTVKLHGGYDERGNAYIYYGVSEMEEMLSVSDVFEVMLELEDLSLIEVVEPENSADEYALNRIYPLSPALSATS